MEQGIDKNGSLGLLALGSDGLNVWEAIQAGEPVPKLEVKSLSKKKRTLLIGWDSADWNTINPLIERGLMPALKRFLEGGSHGKIKTMEPSFSPMLWTSIATGKDAYKHGILGFSELNEDGTGIQPVQSTSRKCHALWNILGAQGKKSNVIGWWPSHPAEPISGVMVTNHFHKIKHKKGWIEEDTVFPESLKADLEKLRVHTKDLTQAHLQPFVPELHKIDQEKDNSLSILGDAIAQLGTVQATTTWLMQNTDWDMTAVYFNDLDKISHQFGKFTAPKSAHIPQEVFDLYKDVVDNMYRCYDMMLDRLLTLAGEGTNVIILSDHGFKLGEEKVKSLPKIPAAIALEHNQYGIVCMNGPDIKKGATIFNAGLLDITPTILQLNNLPVGKDMDGGILNDALLKIKDIKPINSWESQEGEFGRHSSDREINPLGAKQALEQLVALGYIEELDDDEQEQIDNILRETKYNLAKLYLGQRKYKKSLELLEELYLEDMVDLRFNTDIIEAACKLQNFDRAKEVLSNFRKFDISKSVNFDQIDGQILFEAGKYKEALVQFLKVYEEKPESKSIMISIGLAHVKLAEYKKGEKWLKKAINDLTNNPSHYHGLGLALLRQQKFEEAIDPLISALEINPDFAAAHYHLGEVFYKLEDYENATTAFETCLLLNPGINRARNLVMNIYKSYVPNPEKFTAHQQVFNDTRKDEIIVVTGLPRSGTSMLMKMLQDGGVDVFSDGKRTSDDSNPNGYFEAEAVKKSAKNTDWLEDARGKAVKVVTPLLKSLKLEFAYKVIWVDRKISEIMMSQEEMLVRNDPSHETTFNILVQEQFLKLNASAAKFVESKNNIEVLKLNHGEVIADPEKAAKSIFEFLGGRGDVIKMAGAVDSNLHRVKIDAEQFTI